MFVPAPVSYVPGHRAELNDAAEVGGTAPRVFRDLPGAAARRLRSVMYGAPTHSKKSSAPTKKTTTNFSPTFLGTLATGQQHRGPWGSGRAGLLPDASFVHGAAYKPAAGQGGQEVPHGATNFAGGSFEAALVAARARARGAGAGGQHAGAAAGARGANRCRRWRTT